MPAYPHKRKRHPFRLPVSTLAAAIVGILIGAGVILSIAPHLNVENEPAAASLGCATSTWTNFYTPVEGDTLMSIALRYGVSLEEIVRQNCLRPNATDMSTPLRVPATGKPAEACPGSTWTGIYRTEKGGPLTNLADRFGVSAEEFALQNCLTQEYLEAGLLVRVPDIPGSAWAELTAVAVATPVFPELPTLPAAPVAQPLQPLQPLQPVVPPVPADPMTEVWEQESYFPIVIAAEDIPAGTIIRPEMVTRIFLTQETLVTLTKSDNPMFSADRMVQDTPMGFFGNREDVIWQTATTRIEKWQPIRLVIEAGDRGGIGIFLSDDAVSGCASGPEPDEINDAVAQKLAEILRARGYRVTMLYPVSGVLPGFKGDVLIALYTDGCAADPKQDVSGFLPVLQLEYPPNTDPREAPAYDEKKVLMDCIVASYAAGTGLEYRTRRTIDSGRVYPFFEQIDPHTPALALRMGSLSDAQNRNVLTEKQTGIAIAIAQGIDCFLNPPDSDVAATIPPGTVAVSIPMNAVNSVAGSIQAGDSLNIIAALMFIPKEEADEIQVVAEATPETQMVIRTIIKDALVVYVGDVPPSQTDTTAPGTVGTDTILTLAVSSQDALVLQWMIEAKVPLTMEINE